MLKYRAKRERLCDFVRMDCCKLGLRTRYKKEHVICKKFVSLAKLSSSLSCLNATFFQVSLEQVNSILLIKPLVTLVTI